MPSTYSPSLQLELIGAGEQAGTWNSTTNTNLGTLLDQAIAGYTTQAVTTGTDTTLTMTPGATATARNIYIELTGSGGANTNLIVPSNEKLYFIFNNTSSGQVTVKVSGQTGVSVANGTKLILVCNGTDIINATSYLTSAVTSVGTSGNVNGITLTGTVTTAGTLALGGTLSGVNLVTQVTGTLPVLNGGTGVTTPSLVAGTNISVTGTWPNQTVAATGSTGVSSVAMTVPAFLSVSGSPVTSIGTLAVTLSGSALPTANGGTGSTSTAYCSLSSNVSGTLPVGNGGTGSSSLAGAGIPTLSATNSFTGVNGFSVTANANTAVFAKAPSAAGAGIVSQNTGAGVPLAVATDQGNLGILDVFYAGVFPAVTTLGYHQQQGAGVVLVSSSDYRLKENVAPLSNATAKLKQLAPKHYTWMNYPEVGVVDGFIAHELQAVIPHAVSGEKDAVDQDGNPKYQGIDISKLVPLLTAALQEALVRIEALEARLGA